MILSPTSFWLLDSSLLIPGWGVWSFPSGRQQSARPMSVLPLTLNFPWVSGRSASSQLSGSSPHWPPTQILTLPSSGCRGLAFLVWSSKDSRTPATVWVCLARSLLRFWQKPAAVLTSDCSLNFFWGRWFSGLHQVWSFSSASWVDWSRLLFF